MKKAPNRNNFYWRLANGFFNRRSVRVAHMINNISKYVETHKWRKSIRKSIVF
jgi:hypothetical protein